MTSLKERHGEKSGSWLFEICRGRDTDAVVERDRPMSLCAAKAFPPVTSMAAVEQILRVLGTELAMRLRNDLKRYNRTPHTLVCASLVHPYLGSRAVSLSALAAAALSQHSVSLLSLSVSFSVCVFSSLRCLFDPVLSRLSLSLPLSLSLCHAADLC